MSNFLPGLYIVSTPIGNLDDITLRALNVLKKSDKILCEDTRRTIKLLNHYKIKKKLLSNHKFNEKKVLSFVIELINKGKIISLVCDAGTPTLSDPGLILIKECIKKKINVYPIPGVSAITSAMSVSGFNEKYFFYGFPPKKEMEINNVFSELKDYNYNIVFFIPSIKLNFYVKSFKKFFKGRDIFIAREMTKIHETFYRFSLDDFQGLKSQVKGEITIVISGKNKNHSEKPNINFNKLSVEISKYLNRYSLKDVVKLISEKNNLPKNEIYKLCLKIKNKK